MRYIIIARTLKVENMNTACGEFTGGDTFTVPISTITAPEEVAAYWASWDFNATGHSFNSVCEAMKTHGATIEETTLVPKTASYDDVAGLNVMFFDAADWSMNQALSLIRMTVMDQGSI
jgi:hypothetical protein